MSLPAYPAYKDSGIEWLGAVPASWDVGKLKHLVKIMGGQDHKSVESVSSSDYPVFGSGGQFSYSTDYLYDGDSVLLGRKGTIDKPLYVTGSFWTVDTMFYTIILERAFPKYAYYLAMTIPFLYYSTNTAVPSMSQFDLSNHVVSIPSLEEQNKIAQFLDYETAKIDGLIAEQERLIALLKEKRQAVISHAVTKGLNPNTPMKDSGIEWLGQIPAHWEVSPLKYVSTCNDDVLPESYNMDADIYYIEISDVDIINGITNVSQIKFESAPSRARRIVKDGDVLISTVRTYLKSIAQVKEPEPNTVASTGFAVIRALTNESYPTFLKYIANADGFIGEVVSRSNGISYPAINASELIAISVTKPPILEQTNIAQFLDNETAKIDELMKEADTTIQLMKERRSALISAAVTGKIDVRNWQAPT